MSYVVDTSSIIDLFRHYDRSVFPSLWKELDKLIDGRRIVSVSQVRDELQRRKHADKASAWAGNPDVRDLFAKPTMQEMEYLRDVLTNSKFREVVPQYLRSTHEKADIYLIARAKVSGSTVVTEERYKPTGTKIPTICTSLKIQCVNLLGMMQLENWSF